MAGIFPIVALGVWMAGGYTASILSSLAIGGGTGTLIAKLAGFFDKRDLTHVPTLLHFHGSNLTSSEIQVLNRMTIEPQHDGTAIFRSQDFIADGNMTMAGHGNGVAHGGLSMLMTRDGQKPFLEHGKWIVVDTTDDSDADNEIIASFKRLMNILGADDEIEAFHLMRMLSDVAELAAEKTLAAEKSDIKDHE